MQLSTVFCLLSFARARPSLARARPGLRLSPKSCFRTHMRWTARLFFRRRGSGGVAAFSAVSVLLIGGRGLGISSRRGRGDPAVLPRRFSSRRGSGGTAAFSAVSVLLIGGRGLGFSSRRGRGDHAVLLPAAFFAAPAVRIARCAPSMRGSRGAVGFNRSSRRGSGPTASLPATPCLFAAALAACKRQRCAVGALHVYICANACVHTL